MKKRNVIRLHNAVFYAYHGNESEEQYLGGKYHVDVEIDTDFRAAASHDRLAETVNYESVYKMVHDVITGHRFNLIEAIAQRIAEEILHGIPAVEAVLVRVRKPGAPIKGVADYVEAEVREARNAG